MARESPARPMPGYCAATTVPLLLCLGLGFLLGVALGGGRRCRLRDRIDRLRGRGRLAEAERAIGRGGRRRPLRRLFDLRLELAQLGDVLLMLRQGLGEGVPTRTVGDEEDFL